MFRNKSVRKRTSLSCLYCLELIGNLQTQLLAKLPYEWETQYVNNTFYKTFTRVYVMSNKHYTLGRQKNCHPKQYFWRDITYDFIFCFLCIFINCQVYFRTRCIIFNCEKMLVLCVITSQPETNRHTL